MKLQAIYFAIMVIALASCGHLPIPEKPKLEMGVLDVPSGQVITNKLDMTKITSAQQLHYSAIVQSIKTSKFKRVPLLEYDHAISFKPSAWEQQQNYIDKLEDYARNRCN